MDKNSRSLGRRKDRITVAGEVLSLQAFFPLFFRFVHLSQTHVSQRVRDLLPAEEEEGIEKGVSGFVVEEWDSGVGTCSLLEVTLRNSSVVSSVKSLSLRDVKIFQISSSPLEGGVPGRGFSHGFMLALVLPSRLSNDALVQRNFK